MEPFDLKPASAGFLRQAHESLGVKQKRAEKSRKEKKREEKRNSFGLSFWGLPSECTIAAPLPEDCYAGYFSVLFKNPAETECYSWRTASIGSS